MIPTSFVVCFFSPFPILIALRILALATSRYHVLVAVAAMAAMAVTVSIAAGNDNFALPNGFHLGGLTLRHGRHFAVHGTGAGERVYSCFA